MIAAGVFFWLGLIQRERLLLHAFCVMALQVGAAYVVMAGIEFAMRSPPAAPDSTADLKLVITIIGAALGLALGFRVRERCQP